MIREQHNNVILVVDDNINNIKVLVYYLKDHGFEIAIARNGTTGLERAEMLQPDLILLDVMMPRMDGWETLHALQADEQTANIPVLMLTAMRGSESVKKSFDQGSVWYYSKPITDHHDLLLVIRRILDQQS